MKNQTLDLFKYQGTLYEEKDKCNFHCTCMVDLHKKFFVGLFSSIDAARAGLAWLREVASLRSISSNALVKIECARNSLVQGTHY